MKDFLQDLVAHTYALKDLSLVKVKCTGQHVKIESANDTRSVIIQGETKEDIPGLTGEFGLPNLKTLDTLLKCPEYKDAKITVYYETKNKISTPCGIHFSNETDDYHNDYRFMHMALANEKMESLELFNDKWIIDIVPSIASIQRLQYQAQVTPGKTEFQISTENNNLIFKFGNAATHAGKFVFASGINGTLKHALNWPVTETIAILNLVGDKTLKLSNNGAMQITVDSGIAVYNYILPAQS